MPEDLEESTEGDLDPDLTDEAGYAGWEPPERAWLQPLIQVVALVIVILFVGGIVLALFR